MIFAIFGNQIYPQSPYINNLHKFVFAMENVQRGDYFFFKFFDYGREQYRHGYGWSNFWGGGLVKIFLNISHSTYSLQVSAT